MLKDFDSALNFMPTSPWGLITDRVEHIVLEQGWQTTVRGPDLTCGLFGNDGFIGTEPHPLIYISPWLLSP